MLFASAAAIAAPAGASALPAEPVHPPVTTAQIPAGGGTTIAVRRGFDPPRTVDGRFADWTGSRPAFGGARAYSRGELVYTDHIFDAYGPDDGQDAQRMAIQDPVADAVPETYRIDPAIQYVPDEFGLPTGPFTSRVHYGDLEHQDQADLSQVRLGTDAARNLWLLARTTTMADDKPASALLVLVDTTPGDTDRAVPFGSGLKTKRAELALLLTGDHGLVADLASGAVSALPTGSVATDAAGYANAIEARIPAAVLGGRRDAAGIAVAAGVANDAGDGLKNVANVAFRSKEPARDWWDKQQALALEQGTIDPFFAAADLAAMARGRSERYKPGPGYHDRIFDSSPTISQEKGQDGIVQHYGIYIPTSYEPHQASPLQWWFHFRGGNAHIAAAVAPGILQQMGEDANSVVVTPSGRGTSRWYVGLGHADYLEVYDDIHRLLDIDRDREYIAGHSMGGWASYLLPILYPDRFAGAFPASGPITQGAWFGCDADPCYSGANGGRARDQFTRPLLDNLREVPYAIYQGAVDELVPSTGVSQQALRFQELGYRYRYYVYPHEEHYGPPIADRWAEGVKYIHQFVRDRNPARVTYIRSMPFEKATEEINNDKVPLSYDFDKAYWMSNLQPVDPAKGVARFDGRSLAIPDTPHDAVPEAGGPATTDETNPFVMEGQAWRAKVGTAPATSNGFEIKLTGASVVRLDLRRMDISAREPILGDVTTEAPLRLELAVGRRLIVRNLPAGHHKIQLG
jgi:pimeloyl-ACP methyl ester carboxylesterase